VDVWRNCKGANNNLKLQVQLTVNCHVFMLMFSCCSVCGAVRISHNVVRNGRTFREY
jgi:hypothetical protein